MFEIDRDHEALGPMIAACLLVRDEEDAIAEWILYHHLIGFDTLIVVDHRSSDRTAKRAKAAGRIADVRLFRLEFEGAGLQDEVYLQVCRKWASEFDWIAFFDIDEFLVGPPNLSCRDLVATCSEAAAVVVPWVLFGSSHHDDKPAGLIIEDYRRRAPLDFRPNHHVKSIVRPARVRRCVNAHCFEVEGSTRLPSGSAAEWDSPGKLLRTPALEPWRLHHYFTRSRRHWEDRLTRGQLDGLTRTMDDFAAYDRNDVEDDAACARVPALRALLGRMV